MSKFDSTLERAKVVQQITSEYYEPGRQDRSKSWIWRNKIKPILGISQATYFRLLAVKIK